jgi:hypothetical protein
MSNQHALADVFDSFEEERYGFSDPVKIKLSNHSDLSALMLLSSMLTRQCGSLIDGAEHDVVFLAVTFDDLQEAGVTPAQIRMLVHCGVWYQGTRLCFNV